ncbi:MAG: DUF1460 domain-containing protein [Muribaculaceae bacterium]|nr:DUF1460 domain-containing protein [Muribaculaceae bacterium]
MKKLLLIFSFTILCFNVCSALYVARPNLSSPNDTTIVNRLLALPSLDRNDFGHNTAIFARELIGSGTDDYYNTDSIASLRLNLSSFTPISFINTVIALSRAYRSSTRPDWRDFTAEFQNISCRRGEDSGFPSIMWHISDWTVDNIYRGNVKEITENFSGKIEKTKSLDYLTRHRDKFAALEDSATYETVRMKEMGFRTHRLPLLKKETINKKEILENLQDGDIIVLNPTEDGKDYLIIGIISRVASTPTVIYFNPESGKIEEWTNSLGRLFQLKTKNFNGYRLLRPLYH